MMLIDDLRQAVRGPVTSRDDAGYSTTRDDLVFNGRKPPRFPRAIVRAASVEDVQAAVRVAAAHGVRVSARGGGHHWSGIAVQDGVVVDLSALDDVEIDAEARIARVGPTVRNGTLARLLGEKGLAFPLGHCATVPLSGYLLGGGFGWNSGEWGIACFNVIGVDVVTAGGRLCHASANENADIFWAARGAGPEFFGIVVKYHLRLQSLPRAITTAVWTYRADDIEAVEAWAARAVAGSPRNLELTVMMSSAPPPLADVASRVVSGIATVFADTEEEARCILGPIGADAPAGALHLQPPLATPFDVLYEIIQQFFPQGGRYAVDTFWAKDDAKLFVRTLSDRTAAAPSPETFSLAVVLPPPPPGAPAMPDAAFSMVGAAFGCAYSVWSDPADDETNVRWLRLTQAAMAPLTAGRYLGEADLDGPARSRGCFSAEAQRRLEALQMEYDPTGLFLPWQRGRRTLAPAA